MIFNLKNTLKTDLKNGVVFTLKREVLLTIPLPGENTLTLHYTSYPTGIH